MAKKELFSVLVANFNSMHYLNDFITSIQKQTYDNFEVIIFDDASTDKSFEFLSELVLKDLRFKLFRNSHNVGVGATKRNCVLCANGNICGFVDPDDTLEPNAIEKMIQAHNNYANASLIYSNYYKCDDKLNIINKIQKKQIKLDDPLFFNSCHSISHFATFKKSYYNLTEGINPTLKLGEDIDMYLKLYEVGKVFHLNEFLYYYRINQNSLTQNLRDNNIGVDWRFVVIFLAKLRRGQNINNFILESYCDKSYQFFVENSRLIRFFKRIKLL